MGRATLYTDEQWASMTTTQLDAYLQDAHDELSRLCKGKQFRMSIPVQHDDSDIVIGDGLRAGREYARRLADVAGTLPEGAE